MKYQEAYNQCFPDLFRIEYAEDQSVFLNTLYKIAFNHPSFIYKVPVS